MHKQARYSRLCSGLLLMMLICTPMNKLRKVITSF
jgi:hypothetical protein